MELAEFSKEALAEIRVRPVERSEETRYQEQMARYHYLGALGKIGETVWYVATFQIGLVPSENKFCRAFELELKKGTNA